jgi:hypothetical protein
MFAPGELHADDPELSAAQQQAIGALTAAVSLLAGTTRRQQAPQSWP